MSQPPQSPNPEAKTVEISFGSTIVRFSESKTDQPRVIKQIAATTIRRLLDDLKMHANLITELGKLAKDIKDGFASQNNNCGTSLNRAAIGTMLEKIDKLHLSKTEDGEPCGATNVIMKWIEDFEKEVDLPDNPKNPTP